MASSTVARLALDLAIAAHALIQDATLWTLNTTDFEDLPSLTVYLPG